MWGDTPNIPTEQFGHDTFVFAGDTVGTQNYIEDFQQQFDKIEFIGVSGVHGFSDLSISTNGSGDTVIATLHDSVTLVAFTGTLSEWDFIIV